MAENHFDYFQKTKLTMIAVIGLGQTIATD